MKIFVILLISFISVASSDYLEDKFALLSKKYCDAMFGPNAAKFTSCFEDRNKKNPFPYSIKEIADVCDKKDATAEEVKQACADMECNTPRGQEVVKCFVKKINIAAEKSKMTGELAMDIEASNILLCT